MRHSLIRLILLIGIFISSKKASFTQQNFERKTYIEINERANYYHINKRYNIVSDTLFYSKAGFLVEPDYDITKVNGEDYVVLRYPDFGKNNNQIRERELYNTLSLDKVLVSSIHEPITGKNGRTLMIEKDVFDKLSKTTLYSTKWMQGGKWYRHLIPQWRNYKITTGLLNIPFKLRPSIDSMNFNFTTDVTLGPYIGLTKRISKRDPYYITFPATLGLSFINITSNNTSTRLENDDIGVVPGVSWSTGLILNFDHFTLGVVLGEDFAGGVGVDWVYQGETWYSFAIGYSFLNEQ